VENRQQERRRLAAAGGRRREQITPQHGGRDRIGLDRRRANEPEILDAAEQVRVELELGKRHLRDAGGRASRWL
jgi:hypothetical protein